MTETSRAAGQLTRMMDERLESGETCAGAIEFPRCRPGALKSMVGMILLLLGACTSGAPPRTTIAAIQGAGHTSPMKDRMVEGVEGVVTSVYADPRSPRFWFQSIHPDGSDATSEGLVVMMRGSDSQPPVKGDFVSVSGTVAEWGREGELTQTEISGASWTVLGQSELPAPVVIPRDRKPPGIVDDDGLTRFDPDSDAIDFWESLEGMLVELESPVVVGPSSRYGDVIVMSGPDWTEATPRTMRGGIHVTADDEHPQKVALDGRLAGRLPDLGVGERLRGNVEGIVGHEFGMQRILVFDRPSSAGSVPRPDETTELTGDAGSVTIATWNVLNLSAKDSAEKFDRLGRVVAHELRNPDMIGLQEVQDDSGEADDGVTSAVETLSRLVSAIASAGGAHYEFVQIDPEDQADGGAPGSNIRTAFLYNPARVSFDRRGPATSSTEVRITKGGWPLLEDNPSRLGTRKDCFLGSGSSDESEGTRKSLIGEFVFEGKHLIVIDNHLKSKRGDDPVFGPVQPPVRHTEQQRSCQTRFVAELATRMLERAPDARVVVLGDLNEYGFRPPIEIFSEYGLIDLGARHPVEDGYTFNYQGNSQILDHIIVPAGLAERASLDIVHVTVDEPESRQSSDHDPMIARIEMR